MLQKTDLKKCKEIARAFLYIDINASSEIPFIITHPFFENAFVMDKETGTILNILEDESAYNTAINQMKERIEQVTDYYNFSFLITKPYRLTFLKYTISYINKKDLGDYLIDAWISDEYANNNTNVSKKELLGYFKQAPKENLMTPDEFKIYSHFDNVITIYRGVTNYNKDNVKALSWTVDKTTGKWFAKRWKGEGYIYKAKINKNDIIAFCNRRNEKEVIVDYNKLYDLELLDEINNNTNGINQENIDNDDFDY